MAEVTGRNKICQLCKEEWIEDIEIPGLESVCSLCIGKWRLALKAGCPSPVPQPQSFLTLQTIEHAIVEAQAYFNLIISEKSKVVYEQLTIDGNIKQLKLQREQIPEINVNEQISEYEMENSGKAKLIAQMERTLEAAANSLIQLRTRKTEILCAMPTEHICIAKKAGKKAGVKK